MKSILKVIFLVLVIVGFTPTEQTLKEHVKAYDRNVRDETLVLVSINESPTLWQIVPIFDSSREEVIDALEVAKHPLAPVLRKTTDEKQNNKRWIAGILAGMTACLISVLVIVIEFCNNDSRDVQSQKPRTLEDLSPLPAQES